MNFKIKQWNKGFLVMAKLKNYSKTKLTAIITAVMTFLILVLEGVFDIIGVFTGGV